MKKKVNAHDIINTHSRRERMAQAIIDAIIIIACGVVMAAAALMAGVKSAEAQEVTLDKVCLIAVRASLQSNPEEVIDDLCEKIRPNEKDCPTTVFSTTELDTYLIIKCGR